MKKNLTLALILALGAPAAAELAAPGLPLIDAASVRASLAEKENINIGAAFPGMQTCGFKAVEGKSCVFACKDGSTVTRPAIQSSLVPNGCAKFVMVPAGAPKAAAAAEAVYANDRGCSVSVEETANGYTFFVQDGARQAFLGVLKDYRSGDIGAFCSPAAASRNGTEVTLSCGEQHNGGLPTRGQAAVEIGDGVTAVRVRGEVKKPLGWKTDTEISCEGLRPQKGFRGAGPAVSAEGRLFSYNRATKQYDLPTGRSCSVTLKNFKSYNDTEHGSPRDVVSADYVLGGFSDLGNYVTGNAVGTPPEPAFPYVSFQNYLQSGLTKGVDVRITMDGVSSAEALLARPLPPTDVYVTKENSMTSYFGGDGVKWGYWCDLRGGRP